MIRIVIEDNFILSGLSYTLHELRDKLLVRRERRSPTNVADLFPRSFCIRQAAHVS